MDVSIYVDESSQECHQYMVQSALIIESRLVQMALQQFEMARAANGLNPIAGEVKWSKVSRAKLNAYLAVVDTLFGMSATDDIHWHSIIVNNTKLDHNRFNSGDPDVGFNKFLYQLLLSIGRKYEKNDKGKMQYYVYLDERTSPQPPETLREILNSGLRKRWNIRYSPFRRVAYADSKKERLLQPNDLLLGSVAFHKNNRHASCPEDSPKRQLAARVAEHAKMNVLGGDTPQSQLRFSVWNLMLS